MSRSPTDQACQSAFSNNAIGKEIIWVFFQNVSFPPMGLVKKAAVGIRWINFLLVLYWNTQETQNPWLT